MPTLRTAGAAQSEDGTLDQPLPLAVALEEPERRIIEKALKRNSYNRQSTAAELDINRTTLYKKMRKYQLDVGESN
jgi:DNA-binding NtrC family response regulator